MVALPIAPPTLSGDRSPRARRLFLCLSIALLAAAALSLEAGASDVSALDTLRDWATGAEPALRDRIVLIDIRLPRLIMGMLVGAALAVSGALMQGLFRNPLADPGLVGVSSGASLGAVSAIVLGAGLPVALRGTAGTALLPVAAFAGGWIAVLILYAVATRGGRTSVATMLLAGIALGALTAALSGLLIFVANDSQLRDITFWSLGSLSGATWAKLAVAGPMILPVLLLSPLLGRGLNALALGEAAALHLGVEVQRIKRLTILAVAAATGAAVSVSGGIGFVGIVVPHLLRLFAGPDHRWLLPNAAVLGATLLIAADIAARLAVTPAELPIGIVTAIAGAPVFLWILLRRRGLLDL